MPSRSAACSVVSLGQICRSLCILCQEQASQVPAKPLLKSLGVQWPCNRCRYLCTQCTTATLCETHVRGLRITWVYSVRFRSDLCTRVSGRYSGAVKYTTLRSAPVARSVPRVATLSPTMQCPTALLQRTDALSCCHTQQARQSVRAHQAPVLQHGRAPEKATRSRKAFSRSNKQRLPSSRTLVRAEAASAAPSQVKMYCAYYCY